jgi:hypothetical protein
VETYAGFGPAPESPECGKGFGEGVPLGIPGRFGWPAPAAMKAACACACAAAAAATAMAAAGADATDVVSCGDRPAMDVAGEETGMLVSPLVLLDEIPVALEWLIGVLIDKGWFGGKDEDGTDDDTDVGGKEIEEVEEEESADGGRGGCGGGGGPIGRGPVWNVVCSGAAEEANRALCISMLLKKKKLIRRCSDEVSRSPQQIWLKILLVYNYKNDLNKPTYPYLIRWGWAWFIWQKSRFH